MIAIFIILIIIIGILYVNFIKANCPSCKKGRLSRTLTGWGKKAECTFCHKVFNVDWF